MGEKEKGKNSGEKIKRPETKPEPTKNILTEAKTRPDKQETFSDDVKHEDGLIIKPDEK